MDENANYIISKNRILISRNQPVALVVGAAGFLGSNLVDKLLEKNIQVIGVDNLSTGIKENLEKAIKNKDFHFIQHSAENFRVDLPRVDYIFISTDGGWDITGFLEAIKDKRAKILLVSSIELYEKADRDEHLKWLEGAEIKLAGFARENKLNARILRLGAVYGPRMHFRVWDPLIKLIHQSTGGNLHSQVSLQFSSRAVFVSDICELAIKSLLSGATAQKIFDGVLPAPIKIEEAKQILLDPLWYEERNFQPAELPPWPTPNLEKTIKTLNWKPKSDLTKALKATLDYFKQRDLGEVGPSKVTTDYENPQSRDIKLSGENKAQLEIIKQQKKAELIQSLKKDQKNKKSKIKSFISKTPLTKFYFLAALFLITYAIIWPFFALGWGVLTFRQQLAEAEKNLQSGEFVKSMENVAKAKYAIGQIGSIVGSFDQLREVGFFEDKFATADNLLKLATLSASGAENAILGIQALYQSLKVITGEINEPSLTYFNNASLYLAESDQNFAKTQALLGDREFKSKVPKLLKSRIDHLESRLDKIHNIVQKGRSISLLLPEVVGIDEGKSYLFLLQNNNELRPGGGFIGSFMKVDFTDGKLKKLTVNDIYAIDGMLKIRVEPPKELREDLDQKDWFLRDSNWEPDFPTNARQAEWFFTKETGEKVNGVLALDVSAMEYLLEVVGPLELADYDELISSENLFERAVTHAETSFFPGSQAKRNFLTSLANELFNKIFFLPKQNWPGIVAALGKSLEEKHIHIYLDDPILFSYIASQNWAGVLPRIADTQIDELRDSLVPLEANLGANKSNYYLDRSYNLETIIGPEGHIQHKLKITYLNRSPSEVWPAGKYKNRFRVYLPFGSRLLKVLWGGDDITASVSAFADYGRTGYSVLLELLPKEQKTLVFGYELSDRLKFDDKLAKYRLDVIKQPGTLKDPFEWRLAYPLNYKIQSSEGLIKPQEVVIATDLSRDRSFGVTFLK